MQSSLVPGSEIFMPSLQMNRTSRDSAIRCSTSLFMVACFLTLPVSLSFAEPPTDGLVLWLDAADVDGDQSLSSDPDDASHLSRWVDKSACENHVEQSAIARRPTYHRSALFGKAVVRFHGDDLLDRAKFEGLGTGDRALHVMLVMKAPSHSTHVSQRLLDLRSRAHAKAKPTARHGFWLGYQANRRRIRLGIHNGDEGEARSIAWNDRPNLIEVVYTGQQIFMHFFNGQREVRGEFGGTHFLGFEPEITLAIGQHYGANDHAPTFFEGDLAEVLIYNRTLNGSERREVGTYLTTKYSLDTEYASIPQFERDVRPILATHCIGCHGDETREAGLDLRSVASMLRGGEAGPVIVQGQPAYSEMMAVLKSGKMPPEGNARLTEVEVATLHRWIEAGTPAKQQSILPLLSSQITDEDRQHWAYQKLVFHQPPQVKHKEQVRTPIDRFILEKLEQHELALSIETDRSSLARRAHFDLTGLPPSPEAIDNFVAAESPLAYERLIDSLLDSPHFGERWGRYWLDVAGYVEVNGSDNDAAIIKQLPGKWRYRDYVINSLNEDKPFDRFLMEQLAGDELHDWRAAKHLTPGMRESLIATAFLLCANDDTSANELNTPPIRHRVLQRTAEVVAGNLLALTYGCAKCHDHKYEALSQIDYYRFQAIFAPAFNIKHWITAVEHGRADVSDVEKSAIDRLNAELTSQIDELTKQRSRLREGYRTRLVDTKLAQLPQRIRADTKRALQTAATKRSKTQKTLAAKYEKQLKVSSAEIDAALSDGDTQIVGGISQRIRELEGRRKKYGTIQIVYEANKPSPTHVLRRGNYLRPGLEVQPALPGILLEQTGTPPVEPAGPTSGRRLLLARQLTDAESLAGQHVARVIVNRLWQQLIGIGIVETSENFGVSGARPSHPQLLDWLTVRFIRRGWRVKPIIRLIMLSGVYRQSSKVTVPATLAHDVDPANKLLWRMRLRRLDSELIRDAILAVSGALSTNHGGPSTLLDPRPDGMVVIKPDGQPDPQAKWRRSVYILARRNYHLTMLRVFDQPIVATNCMRRSPTAVVTQALALLHDDFIVEQARVFAQRVAGLADPPNQQIAAAFRLALGRSPDAEESQLCLSLLQRHASRYSNQGLTPADARLNSLSHMCHMLFNTNEFLYVQ